MVVGLDVGVGVDGLPEEEAQAAVLFCHDLPVQSRLEEVAPPREETARTITAEMRNTSTEYSTAVAPRSLLNARPNLRRVMPQVSQEAQPQYMTRWYQKGTVHSATFHQDHGPARTRW